MIIDVGKAMSSTTHMVYTTHCRIDDVFFALTTLYPHDISDISIISPSLRTPGMAQGRGFDAQVSGEELRMETGDCTIHVFLFLAMFL